MYVPLILYVCTCQKIYNSACMLHINNLLLAAVQTFIIINIDSLKF